LEQHAGRLHGQRRHRVGPRAGRVERAGRAGDADLPVDLRVVRLQLRVGDGPVGEAGALDRAEPAALDEVDLVEAPVVRREVDAAATLAATEEQWRRRAALWLAGLLLLGAAERLRVVLR